MQLVMTEVSDDATMDLQAVKLLATYLSPGLREPGALRFAPSGCRRCYCHLRTLRDSLTCVRLLQRSIS